MRSRTLPELPAGAISDIAFLLLIFFVTSTQIFDERGIQVTLPRIDAQPAAAHDKDIFHVHINGANEIMAEGHRTDLDGLMQQLYAHVVPADWTRSRQVIVSLHCDRQTSYHRFFAVYHGIHSVYRRIWNEASLFVFGATYPSLSEERKRMIKQKFPLVVSEAEWNRN